MKYIVVQTHEGIELPVLFNAPIQHAHVQVENSYPVAAGFYDEALGGAYGESEPLGLKSRGDVDTALIRKLFRWEASALFEKLSRPAGASPASHPAMGISPKQDAARSSCGDKAHCSKESADPASNAAREANETAYRQTSAAVNTNMAAEPGFTANEVLALIQNLKTASKQLEDQAVAENKSPATEVLMSMSGVMVGIAKGIEDLLNNKKTQ